MKKLDLYHECNVDGASVDDFTAQCCMHCINPECSRSSFGQSKFDLRVSTWEERLFSQVPRMDPADPRYSSISAQKFLAINPPLGAVRSNWVDPRDLDSSSGATDQPAPTPSPTPPTSTPEVKEEAIEKPAEPPVELKDEPTPPPPPSSPPKAPPGLAYTNTQTQHGQMIPQKNPPPTPKSDWSAPVPTTDTENVKVVKPGEKIKIG